MFNDPTSNVRTGQAKIAVTGTQVAISSGTVGLQNGVILKADKDNSAALYIGTGTVNNTGDGAGNGFTLHPGDTLSISLTCLSVLNMNGAADDWLSWAAN